MGFDEKDYDKEDDYYGDDMHKEKPGAHTRDRRGFRHCRPRTLGESSGSMPRPRPYHDHHGPFTGRSTDSYGEYYPPPPQTSSRAPPFRSRNPSSRMPSVEELIDNTEKEKRWAVIGNKLLDLPPPNISLRPLSQRCRLEDDGVTSVELSRRSECLRMEVRLPRMIEGKLFPEMNIDYYITLGELSNGFPDPDEDEDHFAANLTALSVVHKMHKRLTEEDKITLADEIIEWACDWREKKLAKYQEQSSHAYEQEQPFDAYPPPPPTRSQSWNSGIPYAQEPFDMDHPGLSRGWTSANHGMHPSQPQYYQTPDGSTRVSYGISSNRGYPNGYWAPDPQDYD